MGELGTLFRSCLFWFSVNGGTCRQGCETASIDTFGGRKLEVFKRGHLLICKKKPQLLTAAQKLLILLVGCWLDSK